MKKLKLDKSTIFLLVIILSGIVLRIPIIAPPLTKDEAVSGLMAKHIMELKEFPIYFWRAHYDGALVSYIGAIFFGLFGISAISYKAVGFLLAIPFIFIIYLLGKKTVGEEAGLVSALFVAISPFFVTMFTMYVAGTYAESLLFGTLILLLTIYYIFAKGAMQKETLLLCVLGFCSGFCLWLSPYIIPFFITALIMLWLRNKTIFFSRKIILLLIFFCIGYVPALIYNFQHPLASFYLFGGRILDLDRSVLSSPNLYKIVFSKILWRISTVPASLVQIPRLLLPLMGLERLRFSNFGVWLVTIIIYWGSFVYIIFTRRNIFISFIKGKLSISKMQSIDICIIFTFVFAVFYCFLIGLNRPQYMVPLYVVIPIFLSVALLEVKKYSKALFFILLIFVLSVNSSGNVKALGHKPVSYVDLASFLSKEKIFHGYSDYFTAYPTTFAAKEKIIISPAVFDSFSDRYPPYTEQVNSAKNAAYIFNTNTHAWACSIFKHRTAEIGVKYSQKVIPPFVIYYNFSRRIFPDDLNIPDLNRK